MTVPLAPVDWSDPAEHRRKIAESLNGLVRAASFIEVTIADDAATSFTPIDRSGVLTIGSGVANVAGLFNFLTDPSSPVCEIIAQTSSTMAATTGALAGTDGTDTKFTVSTHTDGKVYLENRTGASVTVRYKVN